MIVELVSILFACTSAKYLGLTEELENVLDIRLKVLECAKCLTFWTSLLFLLTFGNDGLIVSLAVSFLNAWLAVWLEMLMGYVGTLYDKVYEKIYPSTADDDTDTADDESRAGGQLPYMHEDEEKR